jgi:hypothetical protein
MDVDGIAAETGAAAAVATIAASATSCANVLGVGEKGTGSCAAVLELDGCAVLGTGTSSAGLELTVLADRLLQTLACFLKRQGAVVAKRRSQEAQVVQHVQLVWQGFFRFVLVEGGFAWARSVAFGFGAADEVDGGVVPKRRWSRVIALSLFTSKSAKSIGSGLRRFVCEADDDDCDDDDEEDED